MQHQCYRPWLGISMSPLAALQNWTYWGVRGGTGQAWGVRTYSSLRAATNCVHICADDVSPTYILFVAWLYFPFSTCQLAISQYITQRFTVFRFPRHFQLPPIRFCNYAVFRSLACRYLLRRAVGAAAAWGTCMFPSYKLTVFLKLAPKI